MIPHLLNYIPPFDFLVLLGFTGYGPGVWWSNKTFRSAMKWKTSPQALQRLTSSRPQERHAHNSNRSARANPPHLTPAN